ncbi:hypothetical protein [Pseudomonas sp. Y24-6]|uniref:hypothetical protein n=1 Tax=Pseudomonas sp. Y24-6 TaxID=2750013 RepID=UPI001CE167A8|nr:hypothetical protein [Pseudomonas sp. Y24-6]MCA4964082.1 hypothetical protein [Pseudomonas sp. Y24-6]
MPRHVMFLSTILGMAYLTLMEGAKVSQAGLFTSRSQRRLFLTLSCALILISLCVALSIAYWAQATPFWGTLNNFLISIVASGAFAVFSVLFIDFFADPVQEHDKIVVLPQDIGMHLSRIAGEATDYRVYVRTGRYFRSAVLPKLLDRARTSRRKIRVEIVLLDFRNEEVCKRYSEYRSSASFDTTLWGIEYIQTEILATALGIAKQAIENPTLLEAHLFLSCRLSTTRIEGSADEILITREDPKDFAYRFHKSHRDHSAYLTEFEWIRDSASAIALPKVPVSGSLCEAVFGQDALALRLESAAIAAATSKPPYGR